MKIGHILQTSLDSGQGGIATYLREIVPYQLNLGHEVKVLTNSKYKQFGDYSLPIQDFNFLNDKKFEALLHSLSVNSQLLFSDFNVLHYHYPASAFFSFLPALRGKKRILTVHGRTEVARKLKPITKSILNLVNKRVIPKMDAVTTVTPHLNKYIEETHKINCLYIPHGFKNFETIEANEIKLKYGLEKDSYYLSVGRLTQSKGLDTIINAYKLLPQTSKKLVIVGQPEGKYENYLKSLVPIKLKNKILFVGRAEGNKLSEFYSNAFSYIAGIETNGLSLTVLEAIGHRVPVITSKVIGGDHGINKFTHRFETQNSNDLSNLMLELENDSNKRFKYINSSYNFANQNHSWKFVADQFMSLYN